MSEPILGGCVISRPAPLKVREGGTVGYTLMSDLHIGAAQVDYKLLDKEIQTAVANKDRVLINGDVLDLILVSDKKRFSPDSLHPRLQGRRDIVNEAIKWAVEILSPAADLIDMIGVGNHECTVEKYSSYDPIQALIFELDKARKDKEHVIHYGGYSGFVDYRFRYGTKEESGSNRGIRFVIYYHHGSGGAAPVTKGLIDFNRKDTYIDADVIWMGHKHNRLTVAVEKLACPLTGDHPLVREVRHIMTGAYFNTYRGQTQADIRKHGRRSNYAADWGLAPQGKGGARIEVTLCRETTGACPRFLSVKVCQ